MAYLLLLRSIQVTLRIQHLEHCITSINKLVVPLLTEDRLEVVLLTKKRKFKFKINGRVNRNTKGKKTLNIYRL